MSGPEVVCGYAAAQRLPGEKACEFYVWLRRVFRNQGVGAKAICAVEGEARKMVPGIKTIRVLLPTADELSSEDSDREVLWLSIFGNLGYRRVDRPTRNGQPWLVLEKHLP